MQRDGADQRGGLAREQLEVVIKPGTGPEAPNETVMAGDRAAAMRDRDRPRPIVAVTRSPTNATGTE